MKRRISCLIPLFALAASVQCGSNGNPPAVGNPSPPNDNDGGVADAAADASMPGDNRFVAPRTTTDQPDDAPGAYQMHALYVEPSDRHAMPGLDEDGTVRRAVTSFNAWLAARSGGPRFRIDTHGGVIDVTYVKLMVDEATLAQGVTMMPLGPRRIHERLDALLRPTFNDPKKLYLVYYDGLSIGTCGDSPLGSHTAMSYVGGIWSSTFLTSAVGAGASSLAAYDPVSTQLPAAPFAAHLGNEAVRVTAVTGTTLTLAAALGTAHPSGELLKPDTRPADCRANPFSRDGAEFTYATFVGMHELAHALGIVSAGAPDHAPLPVAPGHLTAASPAGLADLMYQGTANGRCGDHADTPEASPCQLDPGHRNYFMVPAGSGLVDLAKSVFLEPAASDAVLPPNW